MIKIKGQGVVIGLYMPYYGTNGKEGDILVRFEKHAIMRLISNKYIITQGLIPLRSGDIVEFTGILHIDSKENLSCELNHIELVTKSLRYKREKN